MNKIILISLLWFVSSFSMFTYAQDVPKFTINSESKIVEYSEVVESQGNSNELFNRAIEWLNSFYKNPQSATRIRDQINGKIEILYKFNPNGTSPDETYGSIEYTLQINLKDGKYKYLITNIHPTKGGVKDISFWANAKNQKTDLILIQSDKFFKDLIAKLKEKMQNKSQKKSDNW